MAEPTNAEVSDERLRELLPCHFCGGEAHVIRPASGASPYVCCRACYAGGSPLTSETAAIAAWNRRSVTSQASEGEVVAYRYRDRANGPEERWIYLTPRSITEGPSTILSMVLGKPADYECELLFAAPVSKRVERLETLLTQALHVLDQPEIYTIWPVSALRMEITQALQGGRS